MAALWGGRFAGTSDPLFKRLNDSLPFDHRFVREDITASLAWARAIHAVGILSADELARLSTALRELLAQADADPASVATSGEEDVHSWVESRLIAKVGDLGKKLHTGRSRNDQVATDFRLWCAACAAGLRQQIHDVRAALVALAERELGVIMPGYTHLQRGQPILFSHWCLAYFEMLGRDSERFHDATLRINRSPLGSGALAGTAYPIDRAALARDLGLGEPLRNSLDAVADRDFVYELLGACVTTALHLSRFAEDVILYATSEFAFVSLSDSVTSGSSLMPQKKNPDALELMRAKVGRILGAQVALATTMKGLPLAYNKDLQEDKEPLFDASTHLSLCLAVALPVLDGMKVNRAACERAALGDGTILATDLADYLVTKGVPFRDAHHAAGVATRLSLDSGVPLHTLSLDQLKQAHASIESDVSAWLSIQASVSRRVALGGTAPERVREAIAEAKRALQA